MVSFQRSSTLADVPLSIVSPPFCDGVPVSSLLRVRLESPISTVLLLTVVVVPLTVRLLQVRLPKVTSLLVVAPLPVTLSIVSVDLIVNPSAVIVSKDTPVPGVNKTLSSVLSDPVNLILTDVPP